jgi:ribosomal protein S18 acetylase RimI-like enzyme
MKLISVDAKNIDQEHVCCAIGPDKVNQARAQSRKTWMKDRFKDGLVFKRFDARGKFFIEYMPIEKVWKPIVGKNYLVINCLWVSGQFKGQGLSTQLLNECIRDAKAQKKDGIAVTTSASVKPFLTDKKFYLHHGFEVVDSAPPYFELLALKLNSKAKTPAFAKQAKAAARAGNKGLLYVYSNQCPFMEEYAGILAEIAKKKAVPFSSKRLSSCKEAQQIGSPFGTLGIYYNGVFQTHELMAPAKFEKFVTALKA